MINFKSIFVATSVFLLVPAAYSSDGWKLHDYESGDVTPDLQKQITSSIKRSTVPEKSGYCVFNISSTGNYNRQTNNMILHARLICGVADGYKVIFDLSGDYDHLDMQAVLAMVGNSLGNIGFQVKTCDMMDLNPAHTCSYQR